MKRKSIALRHIAVRNIMQNTYRTGAMLFLLLILTATLYATAFVIESLKNGLDSTIKQVNADIILVPGDYVGGIKSTLFLGDPVTVTFTEDITRKVEKVKGITSVSTQLYLATLNADCCGGGSVQLIGYDPQKEDVKPWMDASVSPYIGLYEVVVGCDLNLKVGDTTTFFGEEFYVVGKLDKTGMGYDKSAFITKETAYALSNTPIAKEYFTFERYCPISTVLIRTDEHWEVENIARVLRKKLQNYSVLVYTTKEFVEDTKEKIQVVKKASRVLLGILFLVAVFSFVLVFGITMNERQKEFGIIASIGGSKLQSTMIILLEAMIIVFIGSLLGLIFGEVLVYAGRGFIKNSLGIPVLYPTVLTQGILGGRTLCIIGLSGGIGAFISTFRMNLIQPYLLIKENE